MSINRKIALNSASAAWCIGQYAELQRVRSGFDAALGFDFMHFLTSTSGWGRVVVTEICAPVIEPQTSRADSNVFNHYIR